MKFIDRASLPHYDLLDGEYSNFYYNMFKNASPGFISNIYDIYFGKFFYYEYNGQKKRYGNCMGVEASDQALENLFKIQEEYNIPISLTINSLNLPEEFLLDKIILEQFVEWIGSFYDKGMRSCTIASEHIIKIGILQQRCPDMRWKNTVNHKITNAQQFIDYVSLGYDTILLDRSLNNDINELRNIKRAQDYLNSKNPKKKILTSLLIFEGCIYNCPFSREHNEIGENISRSYFDTFGKLTCNNWRMNKDLVKLPRNGLNIPVRTVKNFKKYMELVDIFKYSGRLATSDMFDIKQDMYIKPSWGLKNDYNQFLICEDFNEILENNLYPLNEWKFCTSNINHMNFNRSLFLRNYNKNSIWITAEGENLENKLMVCKNQCWECHLCERTFNLPEFDSLIMIKEKK